MRCDVYDLRWRRAGLTRGAFCEWADISPRTLARWESAHDAPALAVRALELLAGGIAGLPGAGPEWNGWQFARGLLVSPEGDEVRPGDIRALPYLRALVNELRRERDALAADVARLTPAPRPRPSNVIPFPLKTKEFG